MVKNTVSTGKVVWNFRFYFITKSQLVTTIRCMINDLNLFICIDSMVKLT